MKLDDIFYGIAVICGILGFAGLGGWVDMGTGLVPSVLLLAVCAICALLGRLESGKHGKRNR